MTTILIALLIFLGGLGVGWTLANVDLFDDEPDYRDKYLG